MKEIQLTQGKVALVDNEDYDVLNKHKWHAQKTKISNVWYARRTIRENGHKHNVAMHRVIMCIIDPSITIDHKDHNGLNNQKNNLRIATKSQNCSNRRASVNSTSKYIGVSWASSRKKWGVSIFKLGHKKWLGYFDKEDEAANAYNKAAEELHGEFANLNEIL